MRQVRAGAWVVLLALAGAQAWASRFYPTPDGVAYMYKASEQPKGPLSGVMVKPPA
jgi:hypothetical protein